MRKKYVIIAEDDDFYARLYQNNVIQLGLDTSIVDNGIDVLHRALLRMPDLIVLDLIMPVKDGFETLADIRSSLTLKQVPVIVISQLDQPQDILRVTQWGIEGYYKKHELKPQQFADIISQHLI